MIINCPICKRIIAKGFDDVVKAEVDFSFSIRCANQSCAKDVTVVVKFDPEATPLEVVRLIKQADIVVSQRNIHLDESAGGGPRIRTL